MYRPTCLAYCVHCLCVVGTSCGTKQVVSIIAYLEPPELTQSPEGSIAITPKYNVTKTILKFTCLANVESRVTEATMYWKYRKPESNLDNKTVTVKEFIAVKVSSIPYGTLSMLVI